MVKALLCSVSSSNLSYSHKGWLARHNEQYHPDFDSVMADGITTPSEACASRGKMPCLQIRDVHMSPVQYDITHLKGLSEPLLSKAQIGLGKGRHMDETPFRHVTHI